MLSVYSGSIEEKSTIYTDGATCYNKLAEELDCTLIKCKDYKKFTLMNHINTVNSIHSEFKKIYERMRGVSTVYINRYLAVLNFYRQYLAMDDQEMVIEFLGNYRLRKFQINIKQLKQLKLS